MSRFNTGNPLGSGDPRDLDDNAKNVDLAVNSDGDTFQDRLGRSRLTWAGVVKSGTGDPAIAVDAAARAEAAASQVQQDAEQIAQEAAQQAVQDVVAGVDGQVAVAESAADRAEAASSTAFVNADVKESVEDGLSGPNSVEIGQQFQVVEGGEIVRYRKVSESVAEPVARLMSASGVSHLTGRALQAGSDFRRSANLFDVRMAEESGYVIGTSGEEVPTNYGACSAFIKVVPGEPYYFKGTSTYALYDAQRNFIQRLGGAYAGHTRTFLDGVYYIRINYISRQELQRPSVTLGSTPPSDLGAGINIPSLVIPPIRPEGTTFLEPSKNLFNPNDVEEGVLIDPSNGNIRPPTSGVNDYVTTNYIKVEPGETYSQLITAGAPTGYDRFITIACYTAHKNYIHGGTGPFTTITLGTSVEYVRLTYRGAPDGRMFAKGESIPAYQPYGARLKGVLAAPVGTGSIIDRAVTPEKTSFIRESVNLYNPATDTVGVNITIDGVVEPSPGNNASDFIPLKPLTAYSSRNESYNNSAGFISLAQYDEEGNFIRRDYFSGGSITTTANTAYGRVVYGNGSNNSLSIVSKRMLYEGTEAPEFEEYGSYLSDVSVSPRELREAIIYRDHPMVDCSLDGLFYESEGDAEFTDWGSRTAGQVYTLWDELMGDHADYITKHPLGQDDFGNDIAYYKMTPSHPQSTYSGSVDPNLPRIFIVSSIHGNEKMPALTTYRMAKRMCDDWQSDPLIEALRFNAEIIIIPVANPSGWALNTRQNGNGVDLNRNFPEGWVASDPGSNSYGGPAPFSEKESQLISQALYENSDIHACYDFHNFGVLANSPFIWIPTTAGRKVERMGQMLIQSLTRKWRKEYPTWIPADMDWFAGYTNASRGAMVQDHAYRAHGIRLSATFETAQRFNLQPGAVNFNEVAQGASLTAFVNWLLVNLREIVRRG